MAQHLVASLGDEAYAVAPTLARPNSGTMQQRCTASAHGQCRKLDGPKEEHGTGDDRDDGSLCGPCPALWFSRDLRSCCAARFSASARTKVRLLTRHFIDLAA